MSWLRRLFRKGPTLEQKLKVLMQKAPAVRISHSGRVVLVELMREQDTYYWVKAASLSQALDLAIRKLNNEFTEERRLRAAG